MKIGDARLMKKLNVNTVRKILKAKKTMTKPELSEISGLSVVTINAIIQELVDSQEVLKLKETQSTAGRKATLYAYNGEFELFLTVCLSQEKENEVVDIVVANAFGEAIVEERKEVQQLTLSFLIEALAPYVARYSTLKLISVGIPGQEINGRLTMIDFEKLLDVQLEKTLTERFQLPVILENDINAAIIGFCTSEKFLQSESVVGLYYPDSNPPGAGIYLNGKLIKGKNGLAGEIKYLPVKQNWETVVTATDIEENIIQSAQSLVSMYDPHHVVVFGTHATVAVKQKIEERIEAVFPAVEKTTVTVRQGFYAYYVYGMICLSLQRLNTQYEVSLPFSFK
ncbi:ROK family protein [Brochothrix thermosphacta]|uniref:ROK family protein n=1 Tax=Brochothrix thermosphacta TaxID=2756 RepID=UPI0027127255|nr:ROK family protein [Brochothrix thermosphacta]MDO7863998.1 ROK family protein [Brochothrix thermosphacta]